MPEYQQNDPRYQQATRPTSIEANQANFGERYRPIDAARYQTEQAQAYYERMRSQVNEQSKSLLSRNQGIHTEGAGSSAYQAMTAGRTEPAERDYRTNRRRDRAYTRDVTERVMQAPLNAYDAFNEFGAEFGFAEPVEDAVQKSLMGGAGGMGWAGATGRSMLVGGGAGLAAFYAAEGAAQYAGVREGFGQFEEISNLRGASRPMTAGTAAGPNGRMSRDMAQNILTDLSKEGRGSFLERDGEDLGEMKEQVGILADYQLLEGVRSADEFEKTFKRLKEGVKKVMEVMGTTFEEGTKLMKDFRNVGISPMEGTRMINQGRLTSAQYGNNFQEGHASGMQSMMAMRGTGFSAGASYQMGQFASGMSQTIYEGNYLDDKTTYAVGGQRGIQQTLQRSSMQFMESPQFTAMMMGAKREDGQYDTSNILQTLTGQRDSGDNAAAAGRNINSIEDVLEFRNTNREFMSQMMEDSPAMLEGLKVQSVMNMARRAGMSPEEMTEGEIAEFAGSTGMMTPDAFKTSAAAVRAYPETAGRRRREERRTAESRALDMHRTGFFDQVSEGIRELPLVRSFVEGSSRLAGATRDEIYDFQQGTTEYFSETFTGRPMVTANGDAAQFFAQQDDIESEGGIDITGRGMEVDSGRFVRGGQEDGGVVLTPTEMRRGDIDPSAGRELSGMSQEQRENLELGDDVDRNVEEEGRLVDPSQIDQNVEEKTVEGTYYTDTNDFLSQNDDADIVSERGRREDTVDPVVTVPDSRIQGEITGVSDGGGDKKMFLTPEEVEQVEAKKGPDFELEGTKGPDGLLEVNYRQMAEQSFTTVETEPERQSGDNIVDNLTSSPIYGQLGIDQLQGVGGLLGAATDREQNQIYFEPELQEQEKQDQRFAQRIAAAREAVPETEGVTVKSDLSEEGAEAFEKLMGKGLDMERLRKIRNMSGEDGNMEIQNMIKDRMSNAFNIEIDKEPGESGFMDQMINAADREGVQEGLGLFMQRASTEGNIEQMARRAETFFDGAQRSSQELDDIHESMGVIAETAGDSIFSEGPFDFVLGEEGQKAQEKGVVTAVAMQDYVDSRTQKGEDPSDVLSDRQLKRFQRIQQRYLGGISGENKEKLEQRVRDLVKRRDDLSMEDIYESADQMIDEGYLSPGGEQTTALQSSEQRQADPGRGTRQEVRNKLLKVARLLSDMQSNQESLAEEIRMLHD